MKNRKAILLRLDEHLFKQMKHAVIESKHPSVNAWVEEAVREKLDRELGQKLG